MIGIAVDFVVAVVAAASEPIQVTNSVRRFFIALSLFQGSSKHILQSSLRDDLMNIETRK